MCKHPWVRIPLSPPNFRRRTSSFCIMEKYPSGRRGSPAKGVGRETGARVQIPPSPPKNGHPYGCPFFNAVRNKSTWTEGSEQAICRLLRLFIRGVHGLFCFLLQRRVRNRNPSLAWRMLLKYVFLPKNLRGPLKILLKLTI